MSSLFLIIPYEIYGEILRYLNQSKDVISLMFTTKDLYNFFLHNVYAKCDHIVFYRKQQKIQVKIHPFIKNVYIYPLTDSQEFQYLKGIHTLDMNHCFQITDKEFVHLKGIHTLNMGYCYKITDKAFAHLKGIHTLNMTYCSQISDKAFENLKGIHTLDMIDCDQISDKAFVHLKGIHRLIK